MDAERKCPNCGKVLVRRRGEKKGVWEERQFCSRSCVTHHLPDAFKLRHQVNRRPHKALQDSGRSHQYEANSAEALKARVVLSHVTCIDTTTNRLWRMRRPKVPELA